MTDPRPDPAPPRDPPAGSLPDGQQPASASEGEAVPAPEGTTEIIETGYVIGQDNLAHVVRIEFDIHKPVFLVSSLAIIAFTVMTLIFQAQLEPFFGGLRDT
ncbi:MAG TPA: hypothetical protein PLL33_15580, partial [Paracoccus sp. (in: a-proteobacteria)]|nr:hypothetical protein [Paracoccus sp. (in: a-proteobacteria)]